jgi:hypothetical protein
MTMQAYSPMLSVLTAVFEITAAVWTLSGPGRRRFILPCGIILLLLAGYQITEVIACSNPARTSAARIGFLDILWLPASGVLLVLLLSSLRRATVILAACAYFAVAAALAVGILLEPDFVNVSVCKGVFARYAAVRPLYTLFGAYYQFGIASMLIWAAAAMTGQEDWGRRKHTADVLIGTLCFVLPSMWVEISVPPASGAMPSIMCHFALIFALFLVRLAQRERSCAIPPDPPLGKGGKAAQ